MNLNIISPSKKLSPQMRIARAGEVKKALAAARTAQGAYQTERSRWEPLLNPERAMAGFKQIVRSAETPEEIVQARVAASNLLSELASEGAVRAAKAIRAAHNQFVGGLVDLLNAAERELTTIDKEAREDEAAFFSVYGLRPELTAVSRRLESARAWIANQREMLTAPDRQSSSLPGNDASRHIFRWFNQVKEG